MNCAQRFIRSRRLSNRPVRKYAASVLSLATCASAASDTSREHVRAFRAPVHGEFQNARDPSVDHLATLRENPNLAFFFVQVDGTILHGWSSPVRYERVAVMWSARYDVTKGDQPLHPIYGLSADRTSGTCTKFALVPGSRAGLSEPLRKTARWSCTGNVTTSRCGRNGNNSVRCTETLASAVSGDSDSAKNCGRCSQVTTRSSATRTNLPTTPDLQLE